jgi:hypothetical protein
MRRPEFCSAPERLARRGDAFGRLAARGGSQAGEAAHKIISLGSLEARRHY